MPDSRDQRDLVVIGAGPGGYVAAVRAAQLGLKVVVVEKEAPGGVCLNWGCIPSKNLIHQASMFRSLAEIEAVGVGIDRSTLDYVRVQAKSREVVETLTGGVRSLLKRNDVQLMEGEARISGPRQVTINGSHELSARAILLATGSRPLEVPGFEFDEELVLSSTGALAMRSLPESLIILGAGAIGCEFAYVLSCFGVLVTLVEALPHILPAEDEECGALLQRCFERAGVTVRTSTRALGLERLSDGVRVTLERDGQGTEICGAEKALVVFGRQPNTQGLGLRSAGVQLDSHGYVQTGDFQQTTVPSIYAIGDLTASPALAHVASKEGEIAVQHMAGRHSGAKRVDLQCVPSAVYCEPQVAGFGLREQQAQALGVEVKKSVFPYPGAGKSIAIGKADGFVKILVDAQTDEMLGAHIVGHNATELIHELLIARHSELLPEDIAEMVHAHPTLSEAVMESARGINGRPIHG